MCAPVPHLDCCFDPFRRAVKPIGHIRVERPSPYRWSTGNTGTPGFFYSKVVPKTGCRGDTSNTIHVLST